MGVQILAIVCITAWTVVTTFTLLYVCMCSDIRMCAYCIDRFYDRRSQLLYTRVPTYHFF